MASGVKGNLHYEDRNHSVGQGHQPRLEKRGQYPSSAPPGPSRPPARSPHLPASSRRLSHCNRTNARAKTFRSSLLFDAPGITPWSSPLKVTSWFSGPPFSPISTLVSSRDSHDFSVLRTAAFQCEVFWPPFLFSVVQWWLWEENASSFHAAL